MFLIEIYRVSRSTYQQTMASSMYRIRSLVIFK